MATVGRKSLTRSPSAKSYAPIAIVSVQQHGQEAIDSPLDKNPQSRAQELHCRFEGSTPAITLGCCLSSKYYYQQHRSHVRSAVRGSRTLMSRETLAPKASVYTIPPGQQNPIGVRVVIPPAVAPTKDRPALQCARGESNPYALAGTRI